LSETAGAPFGHDIASREDAETGNKWEKIVSAVKCGEGLADGGGNTGKVVSFSKAVLVQVDRGATPLILLM